MKIEDFIILLMKSIIKKSLNLSLSFSTIVIYKIKRKNTLLRILINLSYLVETEIL